MILLRDGEWFWLCVCGWQSPPSPALALVTTWHICGSGDRPGDGAWVATPVPFGEPEVLAYPSRPAYQSYLKRGVVLHVERRHATRAGLDPCRNTTMCPALTLVGEVNTTLSPGELLIGCWHWAKYRLLSHCWAQGCPIPSRLNILHGPWQLRRCENTPMAISLTEKGMARMVVAEAEDLIA